MRRVKAVRGLAVTYRPVDELKPYEGNPRTHSAEQVAQIAASIGEFGFTNPLLIAGDGVIIAGHGRLLAAQSLGMSEVPCIVLDHLSEAQRRALVIADNRLALSAGWDEEKLRAELDALAAEDFDLDLLGFDVEELDDILSSWGEGGGEKAAEAPAPEPPSEPATRRGDTWILGRHRVRCGDSTLGGDVAALLAGARADLVITDPPYCSGGFQESERAAGSVGTKRVRGGKEEPKSGRPSVHNDTLSTRGYRALLAAALAPLAPVSVYACTDWRQWPELFDVVEAGGWGVRSMIVWDKGSPGIGLQWRPQHELILYATRAKRGDYEKARGRGNVIAVPRTGNQHHPTEKPVELVTRLLEVDYAAAVVADPFAGSGSTVIACELAGRSCLAMEIDPAFVDVTVRRWEETTGEAATLEGDGRTFAQVAAARTEELAALATPARAKRRRRKATAEA